MQRHRIKRETSLERVAREGLSQELSFGQRPGKDTPGEEVAWSESGWGSLGILHTCGSV